MGDALAVALLETRGFSADDFARAHPGGQLGRRLLLHVADIMHQGDRVPSVLHTVSLAEALHEMSIKGLGMTAIVNEQQQLRGVFTDGDLRRALEQPRQIHSVQISEIMTSPCQTIDAEALAVDAVQLMQNRKINGLLVTNAEQHVVGALNMHDLLRAGVV